MVYTQMLFALFYDKLIWDSTPSAISWTGSGIILGSAIYVAFARDGGKRTGGLNDGGEGDIDVASRRSGLKWSVRDENRLGEGRNLLESECEHENDVMHDVESGRSLR